MLLSLYLHCMHPSRGEFGAEKEYRRPKIPVSPVSRLRRNQSSINLIYQGPNVEDGLLVAASLGCQARQSNPRNPASDKHS